MYAVDDLSDAIDVTRDFLTPIEPGRWLKLAVVVVFLSGLSFSPPMLPGGQPNPTPGTEPMPDGSMPVEQQLPTDQLIELAIVFALVGLAAWLVFTLIGSLLEFVLVDALRSGSVSIRAGLRRHARKGLALFAFRVVLGVLAFATVAIPAYLSVAPIDSIDAIERVSPSTLVGLVALAVVVGLTYGLISRLTTEFVVPVMLQSECGVRGGWGRFWRTLRGHAGEYAVYAVLATIVDVVAAIALGIATAFVGFFVAIPFVLLALVALLFGPLAIPVLVVIVLAALLTFLLIGGLLRMPVVVYVRYYALLVLGDTDPDLDLIPDRRDAARSGTGWDEWDGGDGADGRAGWKTDSRSEWAGPDDEATDNSWDSGWGTAEDESNGVDHDDDDADSDWGYRE